MGTKSPIDVFGPTTLRIMGKAYQRACGEAAKTYQDGTLPDAAKGTIAKSVVHGASEGKRDAVELSDHALKRYKTEPR